jgi:hypothetical protein
MIGQRVGVGWLAFSCLSCPECLAGNHNLCLTTQGTIVGRPLRLREPPTGAMGLGTSVLQINLMLAGSRFLRTARNYIAWPGLRLFVQLLDGYFRKYAELPFPLTPGHEIAGVVHKIGSLVPESAGWFRGWGSGGRGRRLGRWHLPSLPGRRHPNLRPRTLAWLRTLRRLLGVRACSRPVSRQGGQAFEGRRTGPAHRRRPHTLPRHQEAP